MIQQLFYIFNAPKPYGFIIYCLEFLPIFISILLILLSLYFIVLCIKEKPKMFYSPILFNNIIVIQVIFSAIFYSALQYRWIVLQFEATVISEICWIVSESLFLFNVFWAILILVIDIHKKRKLK